MSAQPGKAQPEKLVWPASLDSVTDHVTASEEIHLAVQNTNTSRAHSCVERRAVAPLPAVRVVRLDGEDIHPLPTTSQLTTTNDVGPVSHGGSAMPASRRAQTALILPAVGGGVVRAHSPGVSVVDVTTGYKDLALDEGAAVTAAGHLHGSFHLPLVGGGHVALHRGLNAITISPSNGKQKAIEDVEAKMVIHGINKETVALGVLHHSGCTLDMIHQVLGRDGAEADESKEIRRILQPLLIKVQPLHGDLEGCDLRGKMQGIV
ncbi:hypothetical protein F7725_024123 [Dissostichus mawsoni]|uniref:Uncharacterized protein n=1 Tax=Dissostichus mawsoni TaxID=36200 RepID=A0A7J5XYJ8_DISMA|nr:hypothetical protein F7725_024123 [Dissostichus mawsoni]